MEHVALGTDEAGRGCIAGSLVVGACAFYPRPPTLLRAAIKVLSDSKSLKKEQRERLYDATLGYHSGVITSYAVYPAVLVDHLNILQASLIGMATSCSMVIEEYPDTTCLFQVKADGNKVPPIYDYCAETDIAGVEAVVKGDVHVPECAVASYVAKVQHDRIFQKVTNDAHALSEHMGWKTNQGYPGKGAAEKLLEHFMSNDGYREYLPFLRVTYAPLKKSITQFEAHKASGISTKSVLWIRDPDDNTGRKPLRPFTS